MVPKHLFIGNCGSRRTAGESLVPEGSAGKRSALEHRWLCIRSATGTGLAANSRKHRPGDFKYACFPSGHLLLRAAVQIAVGARPACHGYWKKTGDVFRATAVDSKPAPAESVRATAQGRNRRTRTQGSNRPWARRFRPPTGNPNAAWVIAAAFPVPSDLVERRLPRLDKQPPGGGAQRESNRGAGPIRRPDPIAFNPFGGWGAACAADRDLSG